MTGQTCQTRHCHGLPRGYKEEASGAPTGTVYQPPCTNQATIRKRNQLTLRAFHNGQLFINRQGGRSPRCTVRSYPHPTFIGCRSRAGPIDHRANASSRDLLDLTATITRSTTRGTTPVQPTIAARQAGEAQGAMLTPILLIGIGMVIWVAACEYDAR